MGEVCFLKLLKGQVGSTGIRVLEVISAIDKETDSQEGEMTSPNLKAELGPEPGFLTPCLSFTALLVVP